jgi:glyoxylase-like metal-dependent hydrolase (beta-lactamase superfamily II)
MTSGQNSTGFTIQMDAITAQLQMRDMLVHAGTGSGKTMVAAGPHAYKSSKEKVTLMVLPLIALHDEQVNADCLARYMERLMSSKVDTFRDEFKLKAIAVNSSNGGCKPEILQACHIHPDHWSNLMVEPVRKSSPASTRLF